MDYLKCLQIRCPQPQASAIEKRPVRFECGSLLFVRRCVAQVRGHRPTGLDTGRDYVQRHQGYVLERGSASSKDGFRARFRLVYIVLGFLSQRDLY